MDDQSIINQRIAYVVEQSEHLRDQLARFDAELAELTAAANVIARLVGAKRTDRQNAAARSLSETIHRAQDKDRNALRKKSDVPTMPEYIIMALEHEKRPMAPKEITETIRRKWWPEVDAHKIGSIVWRLSNRNDIEKIEGTSNYRLPTKDEGPDGGILGGKPSEPSLFGPFAQDRKAGSGGGA
ncbi:MAG: hypothetical protein JWS10_2441 [Cypionkella sp.]|uniref:hypothetical protein n=1 Tax=Cypionkella sp. TaxID=2811411 RepID=UPI00260E91CB|nr:hypothetical protein [Cypionkella sp.]MDB5659826.1 hypothetical protein [Cypionkella sp.]